MRFSSTCNIRLVHVGAPIRLLRMRAMEDGLEVSVCRAFPSSFSLDCGKDGQPVTVLANGTPFVYLLDPCTARLQVHQHSYLSAIVRNDPLLLFRLQ